MNPILIWWQAYLQALTGVWAGIAARKNDVPYGTNTSHLRLVGAAPSAPTRTASIAPSFSSGHE